MIKEREQPDKSTQNTDQFILWVSEKQQIIKTETKQIEPEEESDSNSQQLHV